MVSQLAFTLGWFGVSCLEMCPAVVPCATADEESGRSLKLGSRVDQLFVLLGIRKLVLEMFSFK